MPFRTEHRFKAMGGPCTVFMDSHTPLQTSVLLGLEAEIGRLEQKYSRYRTDSLLSTINAAAGQPAPIAIDPETAGLCAYLDELYQQSQGRFDATSGILRRAWDFRSGTVPAAGAIEALLPLIDWPSVEWDDHGIRLPRPGMELDLGGLVKEYAVDCGIRYLAEQGVQHALLDMAGDLAALGPQGDGLPWSVAITHPRSPGSSCATLPMTNLRLASSGDYERCMIIDGVRYSHHLNPTTGLPVRGLIAASVQGEQCMVAGSVATVAMLAPDRESALTWLRESGLPWCAVDSELQVHGPLGTPDARASAGK
ncbi:hypothetical protein A3709_15380 [Halioglobus sp. HI00S01]|uniref:FAD:protein FMN transferase n=1 Tax=Halioglobus sp. HI00S01 TaxID=1822214 RepID=UPI0007C21453|nr:FAD:protein FMN transferase [Halioglobus sp. HI00S01]KZX58944.1 hypothetical protein A3709_15380 [Halioglobus sp. HI00S01]